MTKKEKTILFTNLEYVVISGVRMHCNALLLEQSKNIFDENETTYVMRGFGPEPEWPIFDLRLKSIEHNLVDASSPNVMMTCGGEVRPLSSGHIMLFTDGMVVQLSKADQGEKMDVRIFEGKDHMPDVWKALYAAAPRYWKAPRMPMLGWVPPDFRASRVWGN